VPPLAQDPSFVAAVIAGQAASNQDAIACVLASQEPGMEWLRGHKLPKADHSLRHRATRQRPLDPHVT